MFNMVVDVNESVQCLRFGNIDHKSRLAIDLVVSRRANTKELHLRTISLTGIAMSSLSRWIHDLQMLVSETGLIPQSKKASLLRECL